MAKRPWAGLLEALLVVAIATTLTTGIAAVNEVRPGDPASGSEQSSMAPNVVVLGDGPSEPGPPPAPGHGLAPTYEHVSGLAVLSGTLVAVGERATRPRDERPDLSIPKIWWSTDRGANWQPAVIEGHGSLMAVAAAGGRLVAVGSRPVPGGAHALVLTSADGRVWTEESIVGIDTRLYAAVATPAGVLMGGTRFDPNGRVPVAYVPENGTWRQVALLGETNARQGDVRGACARGRDITFVGKAYYDGDAGPLVLRTSDAGAQWTRVELPGAALRTTEARAGACALSSRGTVVIGTVTVRGFDRAFVSVESDRKWQDGFLLEPSDYQHQGHTLGRAAVAVDGSFAVMGYDSTTDDGNGDLATWLRIDDAWRRLQPLDALGAGFGVAEGRTALFDRGILLVGGTSSDRAVVWRTSPKAGATRPTVVPTTMSNWWTSHKGIDPCTLAPPAAISAALSGQELVPRLQPEPADPSLSCVWLSPSGESVLSIQLAPENRLQFLASEYPPNLPRAKPVEGLCKAGMYYPGFRTVVASCGDTAVAVGGPAEGTVVELMRVVVRRLTS